MKLTVCLRRKRRIYATSALIAGLLIASCGDDYHGQNSQNLSVDAHTETTNFPLSAQVDPVAGKAVFQFATLGNEGSTDALQLQRGMIAAEVTPTDKVANADTRPCHQGPLPGVALDALPCNI